MLPAPDAASKSAAIDWYFFLARPRLPSPSPETLEQLRDTSILVTGAGGSIGNALSNELVKLQPRRLVLLDASEQALYRLQSSLADTRPLANLDIVLANILDTAHLEEILETCCPQLIFHAAAYKHVPLLEENPLAAIANNAVGTFNLAQSAKKFNVTRIVLLSTDKAVAPISILGATKRIAEQITIVNSGVVLRLGNILGTEGSVSERFLRQIAASEPVTITDPDAERYFLTCEEAVDLLLVAATTAHTGSILAPCLDRQYTIASLAEFLISTRSREAKPTITVTGPRSGDKTREALWSSDEQPFVSNASGYSQFQRQSTETSQLRRELSILEHAVRERDLPRAIEIVRRLVPDYELGATVLAHLQPAVQGTLRR